MRIDLVGIFLADNASTWYTTEVESWNRPNRNWTFSDLIIALYKRFIHEVTAQNASTKYHSTKYTKAKGALAFYNELEHHASRMVERPDDYSFKQKLLYSLPQEMVETLLKSRGVTAEHTSLGRMLHEIKAVESTIQAVEQYKQTRATYLAPTRPHQSSSSSSVPRTDKVVKFAAKGKPQYNHLKPQMLVHDNKYPSKPMGKPINRPNYNSFVLCCEANSRHSNTRGLGQTQVCYARGSRWYDDRCKVEIKPKELIYICLIYMR